MLPERIRDWRLSRNGWAFLVASAIGIIATALQWRPVEWLAEMMQ